MRINCAYFRLRFCCVSAKVELLSKRNIHKIEWNSLDHPIRIQESSEYDVSCILSKSNLCLGKKTNEEIRKLVTRIVKSMKIKASRF